MEQNIKEIEINGVVYIQKSQAIGAMAKPDTNGLKYVIVRTYSAGVHAGYLKSLSGKEATLLNSRRIWYWSGAASLSQLAVDGTNKPADCKFTVEVSEIYLSEAIEVIPVTEKAFKSINEVKVWKQ